MGVKVRISGLVELNQALGRLPRATQKNVVRRVLKKAGEPIEHAAETHAPVKRGILKRSIATSTRLSKRQARINRKTVAKQKGSVQVFVGAGNYPYAHMQEFGTVRIPEQPFLGPAFEMNKHRALGIIKTELGIEITKAAKRLARRAAKVRK